MNLLFDEESLAPNEYVLAINFRNRFMHGEATYEPLLIASPAGKKQGCYTFEGIQLLFVSGYAYYRILTTTTWTRISGFKMDSDVEYIYALPVPISTVNFARTSSGLNLTATVGGSPQCLIVQDGINQPFVIFPNGTCRVTNDYSQWTQTTDQEYVPIGLQMAHFQGITFIVSPDGKTIYRSVTGRPLDFVVNVNSTGNKGGDATTVSHSVGYESVTAIAPATANALFVASAKNCWLVQLDLTNTLFGEPTFINQAIAGSGCLNQFCITDVLEDTVFVDKDGIKSFNAVQQLKWRGKNSVFSQKVQRLFENRLQETSCAAFFNNYAYFSVDTNYGYGILVYDTLTKSYSSLDIFNIGKIKQFSVNTEGNDAKLFGISNDELYEFENSTSQRAVPTFYSRHFTPTDSSGNQTLQNVHKANIVRLLITDTKEDGVCILREFMDGMGGAIKQRDLPKAATGIRYPVLTPVIQNSNRRVNNITFPLERALIGRKLGFTIVWTGGGYLMQLETVEKQETFDHV